jgi:hypothetical protein
MRSSGTFPQVFTVAHRVGSLPTVTSIKGSTIDSQAYTTRCSSLHGGGHELRQT